MQGGPGETQPGGVEPGVSHLLFGLPGLKMLLDCDADPVLLSVISVILTIQGEEHGTRAFQEPEPSTGNEAAAEAMVPDNILGNVAATRNMMNDQGISLLGRGETRPLKSPQEEDSFQIFQ